MPLSSIEQTLRLLRPTDHLCWLYADDTELASAIAACRQEAVARRLPLDVSPPLGQKPADHLARTGAGRPSWLVADLSPLARGSAESYLARLRDLWWTASLRSWQLIELYDIRRVAHDLLFGLLHNHNRIIWAGEVYIDEETGLAAPGDQNQPRRGLEQLVDELTCWLRQRNGLKQWVGELQAFQTIARAVNQSLALDEIMQAALSQVMALMAADVGHIALWDPRRLRPLCFALQGASPDLVRRLEGCACTLARSLDVEVDARGGLVLVDDIQVSPLRGLVPPPLLVEGYCSFAFMALRSRGTLQGSLCLAARERGRFRPEAAPLLAALSEQIGVGLENARLYSEARRRAEEMGRLYQLSLAAASLDPEDIIRLVSEHILRLFDAAAFYVALADEERDELRLARVVDRGREVPPLTVRLSEQGGLTGYVLQSAQPLLVADLQHVAGLPVTPRHYGEAARSWLGVPLVVKGRAVGVISLQSYEPGAFDEEDQRLLTLAAQQVAAALENARLYQQTLALERRYRLLLEGLNDGYAVVQEGRLVFANGRLGAMLGCAPDTLLKRSLAELQAHDDRQNGTEPSYRSQQVGPEPVRYRTHFLKCDGSTLPVEVTLSRIDYEGRPAVSMLCHDISGQVRLEAQLLQAEKLSAVGQLVAGVAHELNNPLTTIKGYAQLLQGEQLPESVWEDLRRVEEAADRCRRIVTDLLTFARRYEPELTDTDVNELLQRTVALRSYDLRVHNIAVRWDLTPLPLIRADPHRLQQVILNLVFNAEQAILGEREGGLISIRSRAEADGHIRFAVADNGPGILPEHLSKIFDPFFTTKEVGAGTGLGLSISYGIVKEHGGRIWAESQPGAGATFYVELPLIAPQGEAESSGAVVD